MSNKIKGSFPDKIDPRVLTVALFVSVIEFETFTIAKGVIKLAQQDSWLSFLVGGLITLFTAILMIKLASRFPGENLFDYLKKVWGRPVAFVVTIGYLLYWLIYLIILFSDTAYTNKLYFLQRTPAVVPTALVALAAAWLAMYGLIAVFRSFQIFFLYMVIPLFMIILIAVRNIDLINFLPVLNNGTIPVLKGAFYYSSALQGLEIILFISPFLTDVKKALKPAVMGVTLIVLVNFLQVLVVIGVLGIINAKFSLFPLLDAITLIEFPGFPVERFELLLTFPWIIGIFTTICIFVYLLSYGIVQTFGVNRKYAVFSLPVIVIGASYLFPNYAVEAKGRALLPYLSLCFVYAIPVLTLVVAILRSKRGQA